MTQEIAFYILSLLTVCTLVFVVNGMISLHKKTNNRITEMRNQLLSLIYNIPESKSKNKGTLTHLTGEVEMTHPKTGEKLKAKARFKIKN